MMHRNHTRASGNVLFILLIAVVLLAGLTYAITGSQRGGENLGREKESLAAGQLATFGMDIKRAVDNMTRAGKSESTISFAHAALAGYGTPDTTPDAEVFNIAGGGVTFLDVPKGINDGSQWEFYGFSRAPSVGDDAEPDLMLVLPNVTESFCRAYNTRAGYDTAAAIPTDTAACVSNTATRFAGTFASGGGVNPMGVGFRTPAVAACVQCDGPSYHAYYVLMER